MEKDLTSNDLHDEDFTLVSRVMFMQNLARMEINTYSMFVKHHTSQRRLSITVPVGLRTLPQG